MLQFLGAFILTAPLAAISENLRFDSVPAAIAGLLWSVLGNSVASLFYLVPAVSAVMAYVFLGEAWAPLQIGGMALAATGVVVANRK